MELQDWRVAEWYQWDGIEIQDREIINERDIQERVNQKERGNFSDGYNCEESKVRNVRSKKTNAKKVNAVIKTERGLKCGL